MSYEIFNEDCLVGMKRIPDGSIDFILTDLPYQITDCDFDRRIPFAPMWDTSFTASPNRMRRLLCSRRASF